MVQLIKDKHPLDFINLFTVVKADKKIVPKSNPKMTHINQALSHSDIRLVVWASLGFDENVALPSFPSEILYGRLSEMLHHLKHRSIFLSDKSDTGYKDFFSVLVVKYDLAIEEFSDEEASAAEEALDDTCQV